jgi:TRAP-type C4-dicarboxylate transport system permease small subunit
MFYYLLCKLSDYDIFFERAKKLLAFIGYTICILFLMWISVSFVEVSKNSLTAGYEYHTWNFFVMYGNFIKGTLS